MVKQPWKKKFWPEPMEGSVSKSSLSLDGDKMYGDAVSDRCQPAAWPTRLHFALSQGRQSILSPHSSTLAFVLLHSSHQDVVGINITDLNETLLHTVEVVLLPPKSETLVPVAVPAHFSTGLVIVEPAVNLHTKHFASAKAIASPEREYSNRTKGILCTLFLTHSPSLGSPYTHSS